MENIDYIMMAARNVSRGSFESWADYERAVVDEALALRSLASETSFPSRVLDAVPLRVTIQGVEFEESSQRFVIDFVSDGAGAQDGVVESIRSERVDSRRGGLVRELWSEADGKRAVIYKVLEKTGDSAKPSVRIAPYARFL